MDGSPLKLRRDIECANAAVASSSIDSSLLFPGSHESTRTALSGRLEWNARPRLPARQRPAAAGLLRGRCRPRDHATCKTGLRRMGEALARGQSGESHYDENAMKTSVSSLKSRVQPAFMECEPALLRG